jgi:hypothetical protein
MEQAAQFPSARDRLRVGCRPLQRLQLARAGTFLRLTPRAMPGYVLLTSISCFRQVGKIRVRVSALRGNQRYEKAVQLFQVVSDKVNHSGVLDISVTFKHPTVLGVGTGVLQRVSTCFLGRREACTCRTFESTQCAGSTLTPSWCCCIAVYAE